MNLDYASKTFTLDWDRITREELRRRIKFLRIHSFVEEIQVWMSPTNGYHVQVSTRVLINVCAARNYFKDDGNRLVHDILNRPNGIHDVLWATKVCYGIEWKSELIECIKNG